MDTALNRRAARARTTGESRAEVKPSGTKRLRTSSVIGRMLAVRLVRYVAGVLLVLVLLFQFWLRDSSVFSVEQVKVKGLNQYTSGAARDALESAALTMSTLNVDRDALLGVLAGNTAISSLKITRDLPHGLTISIVERRPVATATWAGKTVLLASDGSVLQGIRIGVRTRSLPVLKLRGALVGGQVVGNRWPKVLAVLGAAPAVMVRKVQTTQWDRRGLIVVLRNGPRLIFGTTSDARAKWLSAATVLADPDAAGARYVDLRLPSRPAIGGLGAAPVTTKAPPPVVAPGVAGAAPNPVAQDLVTPDQVVQPTPVVQPVQPPPVP